MKHDWDALERRLVDELHMPRDDARRFLEVGRRLDVAGHELSTIFAAYLEAARRIALDAVDETARREWDRLIGDATEVLELLVEQESRRQPL